MPPLPPALRTVKFTFQHTDGPNTRIFNHVYYQYSGVMSAGDLATVTTTVRTAWQTNMMPIMCTGVSLLNVHAVDLNSATGAVVDQASSTAGTRVGACPDAALAAVLKLRIARRYRGGHPRIYITGTPAPDQATPTTLTAAYVTALSTAFQNFNSAATAAPPAAVGTLSLVNVSYFFGFTNKTFPSGRTKAVPTLRQTPVIDAVTAFTVNPILGAQRRRHQQSI